MVMAMIIRSTSIGKLTSGGVNTIITMGSGPGANDEWMDGWMDEVMEELTNKKQREPSNFNTE
jgi:hypothetical protein